MLMNLNVVKGIYQHLSDDISKEIFKNRLMFSLTDDTKWVFENLYWVSGGKAFLKDMESHAASGEMVIFGMGIWGIDFYKITSSYPWKCFVDSNPKVSEYNGMPVIAFHDFIRDYNGEYIMSLINI